MFVNARHAASLGEAVDALELASSKLKSGDHSELIVADMRDAVEHIGQVVGRVDNERMLDKLLNSFASVNEQRIKVWENPTI